MPEDEGDVQTRPEDLQAEPVRRLPSWNALAGVLLLWLGVYATVLALERGRQSRNRMEAMRTGPIRSRRDRCERGALLGSSSCSLSVSRVFVPVCVSGPVRGSARGQCSFSIYDGRIRFVDRSRSCNESLPKRVFFSHIHVRKHTECEAMDT